MPDDDDSSPPPSSRIEFMMRSVAALTLALAGFAIAAPPTISTTGDDITLEAARVIHDNGVVKSELVTTAALDR